jgi:hypothetical protein
VLHLFLPAPLYAEASTRRRAFAGPLPKNWVHQSDPLTGKVFYLNLKNGELHREHPVLKPILPRLRADKAGAVQVARIQLTHTLKGAWFQTL